MLLRFKFCDSSNIRTTFVTHGKEENQNQTGKSADCNFQLDKVLDVQLRLAEIDAERAVVPREPKKNRYKTYGVQKKNPKRAWGTNKKNSRQASWWRG